MQKSKDDWGFIPHLPGMPEAINSDSFAEDVLESPVPVLIEFWAARCMACRRLVPDLARLKREHEVRVFTLNVDEELPAAEANNVRQIPAILLFKNGKETARLYGNISYEEMQDLLIK
jgi:thioredoxin 1